MARAVKIALLETERWPLGAEKHPEVIERNSRLFGDLEFKGAETYFSLFCMRVAKALFTVLFQTINKNKRDVHLKLRGRNKLITFINGKVF